MRIVSAFFARAGVWVRLSRLTWRGGRQVMPDWSRDLAVKPALGGLAALVLGLLPGAAGASSDQLGHLLTAGGERHQLARLRALTSRLEQLERQLDTLLPLPTGAAYSEVSTRAAPRLR